MPFCFQPGDTLLQDLERRCVGMPDSQSKPPGSGQMMQLLQLTPDNSRAWLTVIKKHIPAGVLQVILLGNTLGNGALVGATVDKKEVIALLQGFHQPAHMTWMASQQAPHMIVDTRDFGKPMHEAQDGALEFGPPHIEREHAWLGWLGIRGLHWKMQHQLPPHFGSLFRQPPRFRCIRQNRKGNLWM